MATDSSDVLMMFEYTESDPKKSGNGKVAAECASTFDSSDPFMQNFKPGYFFEVDSFDFGVGVNDGEGSGESGGDGSGAGGAKKTNAMHGSGDEKQGSSPGSKTVKSSRPRFSRFVHALPGQKPDLNFDIDVHPFSFTRQMDMASPIFFEHCASVTPFAKATLVKRKFTGNAGFLESYLRIIFTDVLLIGVEWDDGDFVKEKCSFVYRQIDVGYRPQKQDGTLDKPVPGSWQAKRKTQGSGGVL